jgi:hypothetical protein
MSDDCCNWKRVYEHRADGTRIAGSLDHLVTAIKYGADVQIRYNFEASGGLGGVWRRTCSAVTFVEDQRGGAANVSAIITDIPDTQLQRLTRVFAKPFAFEWQAYNTSGEVFLVKFDHETRQVISETANRRQIAWYVRCAPWVEVDPADQFTDVLISLGLGNLVGLGIGGEDDT